LRDEGFFVLYVEDQVGASICFCFLILGFELLQFWREFFCRTEEEGEEEEEEEEEEERSIIMIVPPAVVVVGAVAAASVSKWGLEWTQ
jgi:hypothetical protein